MHNFANGLLIAKFDDELVMIFSAFINFIVGEIWLGFNTAIELRLKIVIVVNAPANVETSFVKPISYPDVRLMTPILYAEFM